MATKICLLFNKANNALKKDKKVIHIFVYKLAIIKFAAWKYRKQK